MLVYYFLNLWVLSIRTHKRKRKNLQLKTWKNTAWENFSEPFLRPKMPFSCPLGLSAVAESWRKWGVWNASCVCPCFCLVFSISSSHHHDNERRLAAWVSFLSASVISICWVSCLFNMKLLCLGSNLPGSDKFQEKPILIELFSECYANMSKLCGSQFHSKIWFWIHVNPSRREKERNKNPKCWDAIFHSLGEFFF